MQWGVSTNSCRYQQSAVTDKRITIVSQNDSLPVTGTPPPTPHPRRTATRRGSVNGAGVLGQERPILGHGPRLQVDEDHDARQAVRVATDVDVHVAHGAHSRQSGGMSGPRALPPGESTIRTPSRDLPGGTPNSQHTGVSPSTLVQVHPTQHFRPQREGEGRSGSTDVNTCPRGRTSRQSTAGVVRHSGAD